MEKYTPSYERAYNNALESFDEILTCLSRTQALASALYTNVNGLLFTVKGAREITETIGTTPLGQNRVLPQPIDPGDLS